jgi:RNA polymerase sigma factor (sigma-70 family)
VLNEEYVFLSSRQDIQGYDMKHHSQDISNDELELSPYKTGLIPHTTASEEKALWRNYIKCRHITEILNSASILESLRLSHEIILQIIKEISNYKDLIRQIRHQAGLDKIGDTIYEDKVENVNATTDLYRRILGSKDKGVRYTGSNSSYTCCLGDILGYWFSETINSIAFGKGNPHLVEQVCQAMNRDETRIKSESYQLAINIELLPKSLVKIIDPKTPINELPGSIKSISPGLYSEFVLNRYRAFVLYVRLEGKKAFNRIIESHLWQVEEIANEHTHKVMSLSLDDLVQEGCLGLITAAEKFTPTLSNRFMRYSYYWIFQSITRAIADQDRIIRIPAYMVDAINEFMDVINRLSREYGCEPTSEEISEVMKMSRQKVEEIIKVSQRPLSLELIMSDEEDEYSTLRDFIENIEDPYAVSLFDEVERRIIKKQIDLVLSSLGPRLQRVIQLRFGLEDGRSRTLEEVGKELNVTRERIRQIEEKALRKLRHPSRSRKLRKYLELD